MNGWINKNADKQEKGRSLTKSGENLPHFLSDVSEESHHMLRGPWEPLAKSFILSRY